MAKRVRGRSRVVLAPEPDLMAGQLAPNRVLSVKLKPGEEVGWLWTSIPGGRYVSGYRIVRTRRPERLAREAGRPPAETLKFALRDGFEFCEWEVRESRAADAEAKRRAAVPDGEAQRQARQHLRAH